VGCFIGIGGYVRVHDLLREATTFDRRIDDPCPDVAVDRSALESGLAVAGCLKISVSFFALVVAHNAQVSGGAALFIRPAEDGKLP
jgi:hypothetical protein